jgi:type II pantothenate kinase
MLNINIETSNVNFPEDTIGVDMGQTLSKLAYLENNELKLTWFPTQTGLNSIEKMIEAKKGRFQNINFTGGKSYSLFQKYSRDFNTNLINEFEANVKGIETLHMIEKKKVLSSSLIVTIGTGTSIVSKNGSYEHLGGTAIGGGFFMGLIKVLFNINNFQEAIDLAKKGNRYNVDLKVSDIYAPEDERVDLLFREFTAASLGKIDHNYNLNMLKKQDFINSLICMIGENIGTIANLMAEKKESSSIVFCGGFLKDNKIVRKLLSLMCIVKKKKAIFLKNSEFSAAIGALIL